MYLQRVPRFRYGLLPGLAHAAVDTYLLRGRAPWTLRYRYGPCRVQGSGAVYWHALAQCLLTRIPSAAAVLCRGRYAQRSPE